MSGEAKLLSCPFCGSASKPIVFDFDGEPYVPGYEVRCDASGWDGMDERGCGASSGWGETPAEAIAAWNRRALAAAARDDAEYVVVPRLATDGMILAAVEEHAAHAPYDSPFGPDGSFAAEWKAMVLAAPTDSGSVVYALQDENKRLSREIDDLEEEGCGVDDDIRKLTERAETAEAELAAVRASLKAAPEVEVVKLEWKTSTQGSWARSVFGIYYASALTQLLPTRIIYRWKLTVDGVYSNEAFENEAEAKAAAQSDFTSRIRSCLAIPQPAPDTEGR